MFEITGRIFTIHLISEKSAQIVIKKMVNKKQTLFVVNVFGIWKCKMDDLKLQKNDKIYGKVYVKGSLYKNKWYNDIYFEQIEKISEKSKTNDNDIQMQFGDGGIGNKYIVDEETGEILL
jgi:hypothetical protein